jgi:pilus assembly protein CpaE
VSSAPLQHSSEESSVSARRSPLRVGVAGGSQSQRAAVKEALAHIREIALELVDLGDEQPVSHSDPKFTVLALLLDPVEREQWRAMTQIPPSSGPRPLVVALLPNCSSDLIQAALRAGADDVLSLPPAPDDALRLLLRASEMRRRAERPDHKEICSLVSVSGGRGVSHLTVALGFAIHRLLDKRVVLIDLDLQAAPLSVVMDIEPEHSIADLADPTSPIDSIRLESVVTKHDSGPALLAAPKRIEQTELVSAATVEAAIKVLHDMFDVVLVDCGSHLNESSVVVFENSDFLLYVLDQSVTAVRAARRFLELYENLQLKERSPELIVNCYRSDHVVTLAQIETALHRPILAAVPYDEAAFKEMQTTGRDLWSISSGAGVRRSIEKLTRKLFTPDSQDMPKPGLLSRLFTSHR